MIDDLRLMIGKLALLAACAAVFAGCATHHAAITAPAPDIATIAAPVKSAQAHVEKARSHVAAAQQQSDRIAQLGKEIQRTGAKPADPRIAEMLRVNVQLRSDLTDAQTENAALKSDLDAASAATMKQSLIVKQQTDALKAAQTANSHLAKQHSKDVATIKQKDDALGWWHKWVRNPGIAVLGLGCLAGLAKLALMFYKPF